MIEKKASRSVKIVVMIFQARNKHKKKIKNKVSVNKEIIVL